MKKYLNVVFLPIIFPLLAFAQTKLPRIEWYKIYDGPGHGVDLTNDIKMDESNNIYLAGRSTGPDASQDLLLLKYSARGDSLLELRYVSAPHSWDEAFSIAIDPDSNIYIIGSATFEQSTFYAVFHKYSANGTLLWAKDFNENINIYSEGRQVTLNSKEEAIIGYNQSSAKIAKYSSSGDSLWTVSIQDDTSSYQVNCIVTDKDNNIYAAILQTYWDGGDLPSTKILLVKIDDLGNINWRKQFDGNGAKKIIFDNEGNPILLAAETKIIKLNSDGDTLWTKEYPYTGDIVITTDVNVDSNNDIIFAGYGMGDDSWDYFTQKLSSVGQDIWIRKFNSDEDLNDFAHSLAIDEENNIYVTGGTHNSLSVGVCYTLKYSSEGELKWKIKFDAPHSIFENGNRIFVDDSNNVFIGGVTADSSNGWDLIALKIKQEMSTGIITISDNGLVSLSISQNYPNPFNPQTEIRYTIPTHMIVTLKIYDVLGKEVAALLNEPTLPGSHVVRWDASRFASGLYFYRLQTNEFVETKKLILLR